MNPPNQGKKTRTRKGQAKRQHPQSSSPERIEHPAHPQRLDPSDKKKRQTEVRWFAAFISNLSAEQKLGGVLALVGMVIAAIVGGMQVFIMYKQAEIMSGQTDLMEVANDTNRAVQQATVVFAGTSFLAVVARSSTGDRSINFQINWENTGATPALDAIVHIQFGNDIEGDEPTVRQFVGDEHRFSRVVIGPRAKSTATQVAIPESLLLSSDRRRYVVPPDLHMFGWITYRDIFPRSKPHVTGFCQKMTAILRQGESGPSPPPIHDFVWQDCVNYNCVDERCQGYDEIVKFLPD